MEYQDFKKLYCEDPIIFHLGMELFNGMGRDALLASTDQVLCAAVTKKLIALMAEDRIANAVNAAKDFASLSAVERLAYAGRCGIKLEDDPVDEPGICPLCGETLEYEDAYSGKLLRNWRCKGCGAKGKEAYRKVFDSHYSVLDSSGHMVR